MTMRDKDVIGRVHGISATRLEAWVERGWIAPARGEEGLIYTELDIARCVLIRDLRDDLKIDREAVPVVLSLMDQVYGLRRQMRSILRAIKQQPEDVRRSIIVNLKELS